MKRDKVFLDELTWPEVHEEISRVLMLGIAIPTPLPPAKDVHKKVVEALATRDPEIPCKQMRKHVDSALENTLAGL